jgi:hypothetical protein
MKFLRKPFTIIRANLRPYLVLSAVMYGLLLAGFVVGLAFPHLTADRVDSLQEDGTADLVTTLLSNVWLFAGSILGVNVLQMSARNIVLPSLVVPFAGVAVFAYYAFTLGIGAVPTDEQGWLALIPHSLTVIVEYQAYVLFVLGAYLLGKFWLKPQTIGATTHRQGYLRGLQHLGWLTLPAIALLIFGALYEAFTLIYYVFPVVYLGHA